jgi:aryl-alcohol dehydrogenase-like predicted oxidoreductase
MAYGPPGAERQPPDAAAAERTIATALDRGIMLIDTAPGYGDAESIVANAVGSRPCRIATKIAPPRAGWDGLGAPELAVHVRRSVEASLRRLRRDRVDLLLVHNATTSLLARAELFDALEGVREADLAESVGATVYEPAEAAAAIGAPTLKAVQLPYSAVDRRPERLFDEAVRSGTAVVARSILLRGALSPSGRSLSGPFEPLGRAIDGFRRSVGADWDELPGAALAFVLAEPRVRFALIGPRDAVELEALLDGAQRFAGCARAEPPDLPEELLDPRRWPLEAARG